MIENIIQGRVRKFGDEIDTGMILPGKYMQLTDIFELGQHAMEAVDPTFSTQAKDVILIGGKNFGQGSARIQAPLALKGSGVKAVVAESLALLFFRNAINIGLPVMTCKGIHDIVNDNDMIEINLKNGEIRIGDNTLQGSKLPEFMLKLISKGGLLAMLSETLRA